MPNPNDTPPGQPRTSAEIEAELMALTPPDREALPDTPPSDPPAPKPNDEIELTPAEKQYEADKAATAVAETEAGRKGWVPRDQYKGDPAKWVEAKAFLERGERFTANLQKEVAALKDKVASFEGTQKAFIKFHEETVARKNQEIKDAISSLRVQRSAATREGDDELAVQIEDRIELLKDQQAELAKPPEQVKPDEPQVPEVKPKNVTNPVLDEWIADGHKWFEEDPVLRNYAIVIGDTMMKNGETVRGRKFLDKVAEKMREDFPRKFRQQSEDPAAPRVNAVEGAGNQPRVNSAAKTEKDLPEVDYQLMKQFIASGWTTKEKFLKSYFSTN
jgi:hypothetical protein